MDILDIQSCWNTIPILVLWIEMNHPWKFGKDISRCSWIIDQTWFFSKWLPGGHTGFSMRLKFDPNRPWIEVNHPWKFDEDISEHSRVIGRTSFFKMAARWPYWISDRAEMQSQPTLYRDESFLKIWERYLESFSSYWADVVFQDGCLAAILDFRLGWNSIPTYLG